MEYPLSGLQLFLQAEKKFVERINPLIWCHFLWSSSALFLERDYIQRGLLTYGVIKIVMIHVIKGTVDPHTGESKIQCKTFILEENELNPKIANFLTVRACKNFEFGVRMLPLSWEFTHLMEGPSVFWKFRASRRRWIVLMVLFWRYACTDVTRRSWKSCGTSMKIAKYNNSKPIFIFKLV